jgi:hypothetical protein
VVGNSMRALLSAVSSGVFSQSPSTPVCLRPTGTQGGVTRGWSCWAASAAAVLLHSCLVGLSSQQTWQGCCASPKVVFSLRGTRLGVVGWCMQLQRCSRTAACTPWSTQQTWQAMWCASPEGVFFSSLAKGFCWGINVLCRNHDVTGVCLLLERAGGNQVVVLVCLCVYRQPGNCCCAVLSRGGATVGCAHWLALVVT